MSENIKQNTLKGLFWNAIDRFGYQLVITVVGIIIARISPVEDFGLVAVLMIFTVISTAIVDSGLATSLVRSTHVDEKDYSSMFVFNLVGSAVVYLLLFFLAPAIERFNNIDNLAFYARVLFLQLVVHSFGIVQYVKLLRNFDFKKTARINVLSVICMGIVSISLALMGFEVWAVLLQPLFYSIFRTSLLWIWGNWRISLFFSGSSLRRHLQFSLSFMVGNVLGKSFSSIYYSFIGKHFTTEETAYYYQGNKWGETPNLLISSIIQGTTLSTLAPIQNDYSRFLNACRKTMQTLAFIVFPVSFCAIAVAQPAFVTFLTDKWNHSIPYFQWLCFAGIFISLTDLNVNFLNIKGKSNYTLWLELSKFAIAILVLWATYRFGILYIIYGQLAVRLLLYFVNTMVSGTVYGYGFWKQLGDIFPAFLTSLAAFLAARGIAYCIVDVPHLVLLLVQSTIFVLVYITGSHVSRNVVWLELLEIGKRKLPKQK
ncbi:lipopolysaccharide biosynthesis protein [Sphingobacterium sp. DN00404]|uniref:Lipopolysaccharide biosynthesis protein n=1 Tax=Sphingobacterium micropteri TaxID=2763501 RepID=A0ABR7YQJ0_9SPHI|nr:lipopolysaccharide biosynthesis protein [Sphingobacterium micropteri]MBD1433486.1 lipopolysaccharide biosynthesis protein [Sphingobacterium micropteri]